MYSLPTTCKIIYIVKNENPKSLYIGRYEDEQQFLVLDVRTKFIVITLLCACLPKSAWVCAPPPTCCCFSLYKNGKN